MAVVVPTVAAVGAFVFGGDVAAAGPTVAAVGWGPSVHQNGAY